MHACMLTFTPEDLAAHAARVDLQPGPLSPFVPDASGASMPAPDPALRDALQTMATASSASWIRIAGADCVLDYGAWFSTDGSAVAMSVAPERVVIESPPCAEFAATLAANVLGGSTLRAVELDAALSPLAALICATIFDEARRDAQLAFAMQRGFAIRGVAPTDVLAALDSALARDDGLTALVVGALGDRPEPPAAGAAATALDELVGSGLLAREGERCVPAGPLRALAARCAQPTARLALRHAWTTPATVERAGLHALQFGVHDVIVVEYVDTTVRLATDAASTMVDLVRAFLERARVVRSG